MAIPDYQSIFLPLLKLAAKSDINRKDADKALTAEFGLSEEDHGKLLASGKQRVFDNRIHWAATYLVKAGLLIRPKRGVLRATSEGLALLSKNPQELRLKQLKAIPKFMEFYSASKVSSDSQSSDATDSASEATPEERLLVAAGELKEKLRADILDAIAQSSPEFFERLIIDLLIEMGYGGSFSEAAEHLGGSGDGGVDGVVKGDPLGLDAVYIQAKRYSADNVVGPDKIQQFIGALSTKGATKGVFVTTSRFSKAALELKTTSQRLVLIDGRQLTDLMIRFDVGVRKLKDDIQIKQIDLSYFSDEDD